MIPDSLSTKTLIRLFAVICVALFCITFLRAQGNAITLNGTSQYATINTVAGDMASFSTSHTIEFWFKAPSQVDAGQVSLFAVNSSTGGNVVLFLLGNNAIQTGKIGYVRVLIRMPDEENMVISMKAMPSTLVWMPIAN